jgi:hypothetical protein
MAEAVLGRRPTWTELYGIEDPQALDERQREAHFIEQVAGDGRMPPKGDLNTANALFMTNRINGLDDLIYIVMFGATPYAVRLLDASRRERAGTRSSPCKTTSHPCVPARRSRCGAHRAGRRVGRADRRVREPPGHVHQGVQRRGAHRGRTRTAR